MNAKQVELKIARHHLARAKDTLYKLRNEGIVLFETTIQEQELKKMRAEKRIAYLLMTKAQRK